MKKEEVLSRIHEILDSHDDMLTAIRQSHEAMDLAHKANDAAIVSAIQANRAALKLLRDLQDESI